MNTILDIENGIVKIGLAQGGIIEVRSEDLTFSPRVGDFVKVYSNDKEYKVVLDDTQSNSGININIENPNTVYQSGTVVNKVLYIVLALLVGGIGIHKFYAGKIIQGVLFILFCWTFIPGIIAFIEGIVAVFKPADANGNIIV